MAAIGCSGTLWAQVQSSELPGFWQADRWVWLKRQATGEVIRLTYWSQGRLDEGAYRQLSWFLRDVRFERMLKAGDARIHRALNSGRIGQAHLSPWMLMRPVLLDILYAYSAWLERFGIRRPILITSALRHVLTNEMTEGAARDSWHTRGGAADLVIPDVDVRSLASFAQWLRGGGVGLYVGKGFVHVDCGRLRSWTG